MYSYYDPDETKQGIEFDLATLEHEIREYLKRVRIESMVFTEESMIDHVSTVLKENRNPYTSLKAFTYDVIAEMTRRYLQSLGETETIARQLKQIRSFQLHKFSKRFDRRNNFSELERFEHPANKKGRMEEERMKELVFQNEGLKEENLLLKNKLRQFEQKESGQERLDPDSFESQCSSLSHLEKKELDRKKLLKMLYKSYAIQDNAKSKSSKLVEQLQIAKKQVKRLNAENETMKAKWEKKEKQRECAREELRLLKYEMIELEAQLKKETEENKLLQETNQNREDEQTDLLSLIQRLKIDLQVVKEEKDKICNEKDLALSKAAQLRESNNKLKEESKAYQKELSDATGQASYLRNALQQQEKEYNQEIETLKNEKKTIAEERSQLRSAMNELKQKSTRERETLEISVSSATEANTQLKEELEKLTNQYSRLRTLLAEQIEATHTTLSKINEEY